MVPLLAELFLNLLLAKEDLVLLARLCNFTPILTKIATRHIISRFLKIGE